MNKRGTLSCPLLGSGFSCSGGSDAIEGHPECQECIEEADENVLYNG